MGTVSRSSLALCRATGVAWRAGAASGTATDSTSVLDETPAPPASAADARLLIDVYGGSLGGTPSAKFCISIATYSCVVPIQCVSECWRTRGSGDGEGQHSAHTASFMATHGVPFGESKMSVGFTDQRANMVRIWEGTSVWG